MVLMEMVSGSMLVCIIICPYVAARALLEMVAGVLPICCRKGSFGLVAGVLPICRHRGCFCIR